ncbi:MAG: repressor LexA [Candidatus Moranbacteria bacterium]|nr:repressor LexA [Candidatus Moranbacteria bacterium]
MKMKILTQKQKKVLNTIRNFFSINGKMPTIREIKQECEKKGLKLKSTRSIFNYLNALEQKGYIKRSSKERGIKILDGINNNFINVPIIGSANAGMPAVFAEEYVEGYLKVSKRIIQDKKVFAIQVSGDSMDLSVVNHKKVEDGDFVIVDGDYSDYRNGDKVLVSIDGLATVKTFRKMDNNHIGLFPESQNQKHKPIYLTQQDQFIINGKVIDVLKFN